MPARGGREGSDRGRRNGQIEHRRAVERPVPNPAARPVRAPSADEGKRLAVHRRVLERRHDAERSASGGPRPLEGEHRGEVQARAPGAGRAGVRLSGERDGGQAVVSALGGAEEHPEVRLLAPGIHDAGVVRRVEQRAPDQRRARAGQRLAPRDARVKEAPEFRAVEGLVGVAPQQLRGRAVRGAVAGGLGPADERPGGDHREPVHPRPGEQVEGRRDREGEQHRPGPEGPGLPAPITKDDSPPGVGRAAALGAASRGAGACRVQPREVKVAAGAVGALARSRAPQAAGQEDDAEGEGDAGEDGEPGDHGWGCGRDPRQQTDRGAHSQGGFHYSRGVSNSLCWLVRTRPRRGQAAHAGW